MFKCEIAKEKGGCLVITFIGFHSKTSIIKVKVEQGRRAALVGGGRTECGIGVWESVGPRWCERKNSEQEIKRNKNSSGSYPTNCEQDSCHLLSQSRFFTVKREELLSCLPAIVEIR